MKIRLPLVPKVVGGIACPFPLVTLRVRSRLGDFVEVPFRLDTGADFSAIPVAFARQQGIAFQEDRPGRVSGLVGQVEKYRDSIRVLIAGREHPWPCDFTQDPPPQERGRSMADVIPVLGRAGFLDEYACCIDGRYLILARLTALRRWWRGMVYRFWEKLGLLHLPNQPL